MSRYNTPKISNWFADILLSLCVGSIALAVVMLVGLLICRSIENPAVSGYSLALLVCALVTGKVIRSIVERVNGGDDYEPR